MPTAVVTGANSGIGHAFAELLIQQGYDVHACDYEVGATLQTLQCRLHRLDVRSQDSIRAFATTLLEKPVDVLLNVAGVMAPIQQDSLTMTNKVILKITFETGTFGPLMQQESLTTINKDILTRTFETNAFGPLLLTQALLPNLLASSEPRIGIVSSRVGSIGDNSSGGSYAYRASKAAVNSIGKSMAMDLKDKGVVVSLLHPGFVRTNIDTGMEPHPDSVEAEEAATKLWAVMAAKSIEDTGRFWHREGMELPW